jgi:hypothetical protein
MEHAIKAERAAKPSICYFDMGAFVLELLGEPTPADPAAIEEPRDFPRDLTGLTFGRLTVLERSNAPGRWLCACSCGVSKGVWRQHLLSGATKSCGCVRLGLRPLRRNTVNLMGQRFGRLLVIGRARSQHSITSWRCRCDCGHFAEYRGDLLRAGKRVSCGCAERATRFQSGSERTFSFADELIRDELIEDLRERGVSTADSGRSFTFADGRYVPQPMVRTWIARLCGSSEDQETRLRVEKIFKAVVAGLPASAPAAA